MRILHIVPTYYPAVRYGGPIVSVHGLCRALVKAGHKVHVFTTNVDGAQNSDVPLGKPVELDGVKIWYYSSIYMRRLYYSQGLGKALRQRVRDFDLVHLHSVYLWPTWAAARVAQHENVPYVISPRGMLVKDLVRRKNRWVKTAWLKLIEKNNIEHASALHVTSETEASALDDFAFKLPSIFNIPNGIDPPQKYERGDVSDDIRQVLQCSSYVLYLGRLNWKKGLDRLIRGWLEITGSHLVIAGNDEENYLSTLQELAASLGISDRITFIPRSIDGADKEALFEAASLFVLPSYSENFGNTVLEAMIRKLPVIVTEEVGAKDVVSRANGGLVIAADDLSTSIAALLQDRKRMEAYARNGQAWVAKHMTWESVAGDMEQCYRNILVNK